MGLKTDIKLNVHGRVLVAAPTGELDHYRAERLRAQIDSMFEKSSCRHILLDMGDVSFMDSSGIGMIIGRYKKAEMSGGRIVIANMSEPISRLFDVSGLSKIVSRAETAQTAMHMLGGAFNE
ncbi:MAG: anti-sigma F factor antagonist [Defluviitaleaceae bacterium]|nr:anti-sigma F factor antagonist [Defluviitaleaceae bacterium]